MYSNSIFPVSGALQLNTSGAIGDLPISSAIGAYSSWVKPDTPGKKRFHRLAFLASTFSSSRIGGMDHKLSADLLKWAKNSCGKQPVKH